MSLKLDFELMARYNQWMNERLYAAAAQLDEAELQADRARSSVRSWPRWRISMPRTCTG